jgi:hypothetical protein
VAGYDVPPGREAVPAGIDPLGEVEREAIAPAGVDAEPAPMLDDGLLVAELAYCCAGLTG